MSAKLQKLTFSVGLLDRVSKTARNIQKVMGGMASSSQAAFTQIGTGAAGMAGAGFGLYKFINPAEQMRQALGEVSSLDVDADTIKELTNKALLYSIKYGRAADGFVRSSYDIQSSISGLQGMELAAFTNVGNVLAVGGKSDAGTMTNYMGTMYGIFKNHAEKMGKVQWVEQLAGQTATAIQMFKTDGAKWAGGWTALGANAEAAGIKISEQMAVLGTLQSTMSGSEAGTKYKSFLAGAGRAQDKLNLSFVDSEGNMLGMLDILGKLKGKFGDTLNLAESDALKEAFGSDEAVSLIKLLMSDTMGLAESMDKLGKVTGMEKAAQMAAHMVTPLQRVGEGIKAVAIGFGMALNPALDPFINGMADAAAGVTQFSMDFPNITKWIGYGVLSVLGLTAAMGGLAMIVGVVRLATIGWGMVTMVATGIANAASFTLGIFKAVMWGVNAAMFANPIGLVILGITALVGAVGAAIYWWDDLKAAFLDTSWGKSIMSVIEWVTGGISGLFDTLGWVANGIGSVMDMVGLSSTPSAPASSPSLDAAKQVAVAPGGVTNHIAKTVASNSSNQRTIGTQEIHVNTPVDAQTLRELNWLEA